tara:strand:+ start:152 stop:442 length:291 start_codon:yes stop_codon:yes gene_type:complete
MKFLQIVKTTKDTVGWLKKTGYTETVLGRVHRPNVLATLTEIKRNDQHEYVVAVRDVQKRELVGVQHKFLEKDRAEKLFNNIANDLCKDLGYEQSH